MQRWRWKWFGLAGGLVCFLTGCWLAPSALSPTPGITPSAWPSPVISSPTPAFTPSPAPQASATPAASPLPPTGTPASIAATQAPVIRLLFTGDINPGRCPAQVALAASDFTLPYRAVAEKLNAADITIGSLDGSISDLATPAPCPLTMNLIGPSRSVEGLKFAGFKVITGATNHALDCGSLGWRCKGKSVQDTRNNLIGAGLQVVGIGDTLAAARAPVIVERQGVRFAFLGVNAISGDATWATATEPGTAPLSSQSLADLTADVAHAHTVADVVIVLPHWGIEYTSLPDQEQRTWAAALIAAGANLVIGNHPHLAQPVEVFANGGVVDYALGNFVFDQGPKETRQGVVFEAVFRGRTLESWQLLPVHIYDFYQPRWAPPAEAEAVLARIAEAAKALPPR
jgi:poly-gamma-glutamate capsule biosynthesis protein CapA/YwtB (metallophosphatase superfamily)